jgi:heme exporter protein C
MTSQTKSFHPLAAMTGLTFAAAIYMAFLWAPTEATMGELQRIFYFHVASFWTASVALAINALACMIYLVKRSDWWDSFAAASAEVGIIFCTGGLLMGPLWAKPAWGIWWTWDARLTLTFLTYLMYIAYVLLRGFLDESDRQGVISAVFGIFAVVNLPLVYMANRWFRTQHPQPVMGGGEGSGLNADMWYAVLVSLAAMLLLMTCYLMIRISMEENRKRLAVLRRRLRVEEMV